MPKVYISPSTQEHNQGITPFTNEEAEMNQIADVLVPLLLKDGRFQVKRNSPSMDIYQVARDSNAWGADIHIATHSNAGGGKGEGTEVFAYAPGTNSDRLAKCLYDQIAPLSPGCDRGVKYNSRLLEVGDSVNATACLIELAFHDNAKDALWLATKEIEIAGALYKGICDYYRYDYKALAAVENSDPDIYLSVRVRTSKADALVEQIIKMGYACKKMDLA